MGPSVYLNSMGQRIIYHEYVKLKPLVLFRHEIDVLSGQLEGQERPGNRSLNRALIIFVIRGSWCSRMRTWANRTLYILSNHHFQTSHYIILLNYFSTEMLFGDREQMAKGWPLLRKFGEWTPPLGNAHASRGG